MRFKTPKTLLTAVLMMTALIFVSCGDDNNVDCGKIYNDIEDAFDDYDDAYDNGDCEDLEDLFDKAVKLLREGKDCDNIKDELDDAGYDNVEELIDELEEDHEDDMADCGSPV